MINTKYAALLRGQGDFFVAGQERPGAVKKQVRRFYARGGSPPAATGLRLTTPIVGGAEGGGHGSAIIVLSKDWVVKHPSPPNGIFYFNNINLSIDCFFSCCKKSCDDML
ncbi:MAG: hypothetical protein HQL03_10020 [Nitrospirae bacterium]|nr:hypothetical protein [Nitrospirota bacterium]